MSTKTTSLNLRNLPPEILSHIVSFPSSSFIILKLWKSGDSVIRSKLSAGARHVDLKANGGFQFALPMVTTELRALHSFCLTIPLNDHYNWISIISSLPATLEKLSVLRVGRNLDRTTLPLEACSKPSSSEAINLGRLFPKLAHLVLAQAVPPECLPPTLTILNAFPTTIHCSESHVYVSLLPRSLTQLLCGLRYFDCYESTFPLIAADWQLAPPHLTELNSLTMDPQQPPSFDWLPRGLNIASSATRDPWTLKRLSTLPPAFESLHIHDASLLPPNTATWASHVPPGLKTLFLSDIVPTLLDAAFLASLPRSISTLGLFEDCLDWKSITASATTTSVEKPSWPPLLSVFELELSSGSYIRFLPDSLTRLELLFADSICQIDSEFPPALTYLTVASRVSIKITTKMPPTLEVLTLRAPEITLSPGCIPASLQDFQWDSSLNECLFDCLASFTNLNELSVSFYDCKDFQLIPKTVTNLELGELAGLPPIGQVEQLKDILPPYLRHLSFYIYIEPASIPFNFPPTLLSLSVYGFNTDSSILNRLPRSLESLDIRLDPFDSVVDAPHFPANLRSLSLRLKSKAHFNDKSQPWISKYWPVRCFKKQKDHAEDGLKRWRALDL